MSKELSAHQLTLGYPGSEQSIVHGINIKLPPGKVTVLIGRNGCGKSTLLRALARLMRPRAGSVILDGQDLQRLPSQQVAQRLAILPQGPQAPDGLTVEGLVWYGRYPYQGFLGQRTDEDEKIVQWALQVTGLTPLSKRSLQALSGGQRQRAWIAMAIAQNTELLLLDEPTTYLDIAHQIEVLELLQNLNKQSGRTIAMVLHDLNQAARYADHLVAMVQGSIVAEGAPEVILTPALVQQVFGVEAHIMSDPINGKPLCIPQALVKTEDEAISERTRAAASD